MLLQYFTLTLVLIVGIIISRSKTLTKFLAGLFLIAQTAITIYIVIKINTSEYYYFTFDALAVLFAGLLCILSWSTFYHGLIYLKDEALSNFNIYHAGLVGLIFSITGSYLSNNVTVSWIFMEATTLCVAALIYHNRTVLTLEATWKYVFICSIGIALAYLGILFLSLTIKGQPVMDMSYNTLQKTVLQADPIYLKLAFLFVIIGYSAKLEIFPLYTIGIDANYVAPAPASAFISTALVNAGFVSVFRVCKILMHSAIHNWLSHVLILTGVISLLIAAIYMQRVKNYKRLLAYSTLENMGIVIIAIGVGGVGYYAAILHLVLHSLIKSSLFYQLGQAHKIQGTYKIFRSGDYFNLNPAGAVVLLIGMFVILAIPPSGMFISELLIFKSIINIGYWWLFIIMALLMCFIIYGVTGKFMQLLYSPKPTTVNINKVYPWQTVTQYIFLAIAIYMCFSQPIFLKHLIEQIVFGV